MVASLHQDITRSEPARHAGGDARLRRVIQRAQQHLLERQHSEGYWRANLFANTNIEANAIVVYQVLGRGNSPKIARFARHILSEQLPDGGWPEYRYGPSALTATVRAYLALKLAGLSVDDERLRRARRRIDALGGIHRINSYAKFNLALLGQYDWDDVAPIPPELVLMPSFSPVSIYRMAGWTRAVIVPMSIVWALRPRFPCPPNGGVEELFSDSRAPVPSSGRGWLIRLLRRGARGALKRAPLALREYALRRAERWMLEHCEGSDGLGAILVGMMSAIIAMKSLGYSDSDSRLAEQVRHFEALEVDSGDSLRTQLCLSPVWDTAIATIGLTDSGLPARSDPIVRAVEWLTRKEIRRPGDWRVANPRGPLSGWAFEFENPFYPDVDDTAMVLLALQRAELAASSSRDRDAALERGTAWLLSMQCRNGGWGAYDKDNTSELLNRLPFADHRAMIDPPTADITGRVLEVLGTRGYRRHHPAVERALSFLGSEQASDGSWLGRWGVNYLYGTWQVLAGMAAVKADLRASSVQRAVRWLKSVQHADGGWGETCASYYDEKEKGRGPSTPSQTSWALMALMAAGLHDDTSVQRGVRYLLETQRADGGWDEDVETGTAIPGLLYFSYTLYRDAFPLWALGRYQSAARESRGVAT
jgi:squalene-hopene/tetraprenyl-beta-curcumene cyclase